MRNIVTLILFLWCSLFALGQSNTEPVRLIIKLKSESIEFNSSSPNQKTSRKSKVTLVTQQHHALSVSQHAAGKKTNRYFYVVTFPAGTNIQQLIEEYYQTGEIDYAEPDCTGSSAGIRGTAPNDQHHAKQWGLHNDGTFAYSTAVAGADIDMHNAWDIEQGSSDIIVGVIDSGTKLDHPEFSGRLWVNTGEIPNNGIDDDLNGCVDDINGWDYANNDNNPTDDQGHGTNVAGIIASNGNNSIGFAGVDWNCKLMTLKALSSSGSGLYTWWASSIYYAVDNGADVLNMSLGGSSFSTTLQDAINYAVNNKVVVVVCMMNTNNNISYYPAAYPGVIAVGSTNPDDTRTNPFFWSTTSGSNYGNHISVIAPGNYTFGLDYTSNTNYNSYWGGTSQAAPHVAGLASLLLAQDGSRTPAQIKHIIESTAEDQVGLASEDVEGWDQYYGYGRINAYRALSYVTDVHSSLSQQNDFYAFPNPAQDLVRIVFPEGTQELTVYNALGQLIQRQNVEQRTSQDIQLTANGMYHVQITTGHQRRSQQVIVTR